MGGCLDGLQLYTELQVFFSTKVELKEICKIIFMICIPKLKWADFVKKLIKLLFQMPIQKKIIDFSKEKYINYGRD